MMSTSCDKLHESQPIHHAPPPPSPKYHQTANQHQHQHHHHPLFAQPANLIAIMTDRRSMLVLLIGLTLCISIWQISTQQAQLLINQQQSLPYADGIVIADADAKTILPPPPPPPLRFDQLPAGDATQLINLTDFAFTIDQPPCTGATDVLVIVHSAPANHAKRQTIRDTWGSGLTGTDTARMRLLFLLGAVPTAAAQQRLVAENRQHADLVQGNFDDVYRNLTYKHAAALKWFAYRCPTGRFLLKTDDDVFVHARNADALLHDAATPASRLLLCSRQQAVRISRSYRSKWHVSPRELAGRYYPEYCPGFSIVYSADVVRLLYEQVQRQPFFWIDDVHVTGTLALAANVTITPFKHWFLTLPQQEAVLNGWASDSDRLDFGEFVFTQPNLGAQRIRELWRAVGNGSAAAAAAAEATWTTGAATPTTTTTTTTPMPRVR